jgi:hypothetical protein
MRIVYVDKYKLAKAAGLDNDLTGDEARRIDGAIDIRVLDANPELAARIKREGGAVSAYGANKVGYDIVTVDEMLIMVGVKVELPE